jgi:hypothetical protein
MKYKILSLENMTSYCLKGGESEVTCWSMDLVEHYELLLSTIGIYNYLLVPFWPFILSLTPCCTPSMPSRWSAPLSYDHIERRECKLQLEVLVLERTSMFHNKLFQIVWVQTQIPSQIMYLPYFERLIGDDDLHGKTDEAV